MRTKTLYQRLFDRLTDLVPNLSDAQRGQTFRAPPKIAGDMEIFCTVALADGSNIELLIAHDQSGAADPAPWMTFTVNLAERTGEVVAIMDDWKYEAAYSDTNAPSPRRVPMNTMALNWFTIMLNQGAQFETCPASVSAISL